MSRIGKLPIELPQGVTISVSADNKVTVKGPLGQLEQQVHPNITIKVDDGKLRVERSSDEKNDVAMHGLYRSLLNNMVTGVSKGFKVVQELVGVGYKATAHSASVLELALGYSHSVFFEFPKEIKVETLTERGKNPTITLSCIDKQLLGQVAAKIRSLRPPEPYKGKGIKFFNEEIRRKAGKSASSK